MQMEFINFKFNYIEIIYSFIPNYKSFQHFLESKHFKFDQIYRKITKIYDIKYVYYENIINK
jgi:glutaredoxin-related protein